MASCLVEANFIDREIDSLGDSVTVRVVTKASFNKHGDAVETTSDTTDVACFVNYMSQEDEEVKSGVFQVGDIRFWFKGAQTIDTGDRIYYDSKWYQINNILPLKVGGTTLIKDIRVSKI